MRYTPGRAGKVFSTLRTAATPASRSGASLPRTVKVAFSSLKRSGVFGVDIASQLGLRAARNNGYVSAKQERAVQIKGKTAVVTGGTDGIGIEIARHLKA